VRVFPCRFVLLVLAFVGVVAGTDGAESPLMDIGVRSTISDLWSGVKKKRPEKHGKLYALVAVSEVPSAKKLARPVSHPVLATHLRRELARMGFREISAGENPEIVLTVLYGRGFLRNPYLGNVAIDENDIVPVLNIHSPVDAARRREVGFEQNVQKAQAEKLFITINAWQPPTTQDEKPTRLWKTLVQVDDPDHRDLNAALPAMLAAASPYFDEHVKDPEVTVRKPVPEGTVILGPMQVVEPDAKAPKK
jgi:hypothetical protein